MDDPRIADFRDNLDVVNALAETTNGFYKTELVHRRTSRSIDEVKIATLEYVDWVNHRRL